MRVAFAFLMSLLLACCNEKMPSASKPDVPLMQGIMRASLPTDWEYRGLSGGGGDDGGSFGWEIGLGNRGRDHVMRELAEILKTSVTGCGLEVRGGGASGGDDGMDGFSFSTKGGTSKGRVVVRSAPIDANKILVLVAVVQINAWEAP